MESTFRRQKVYFRTFPMINLFKFYNIDLRVYKNIYIKLLNDMVLNLMQYNWKAAKTK